MATSDQATRSGPPKPPVLRITRYDLATAFLLALAITISLSVFWLGGVWYTNRPASETEPVPLEMLELPGGADEGAVDETLKVQSPEDVVDDPSVVDTPEEESRVKEVLDNVLELSDEASQQLQRQQAADAQNTGQAGSATGTGRRALGMGTGDTGLPREKRWFIHFSDGTLSQYARQLDHFGIELGALLPGGELVYLSNVSSDSPQTRRVTSGAGENRLYMTWQGGRRKLADIKLFQKAGVDVGSGVIFHFYPPETENRLARLERDYANRTADEIRRTYFVVRRRGYDEYEFEVTRQSYFDE